MASHNPMPVACDRHALAERIWSEVVKAPGCWLWTGATIGGYGRIRACQSRYIVTRLIWWLETAQDPGDLCVLHRCDNPPCCRPGHLFLGTQSDNVADMAAKGRANNTAATAAWRARTHCKNGHEYTPGNTEYTKSGHRDCLACRREYARLTKIRWPNRKHCSPPD